MAKSKWSDIKEKLILVECWARDGLTDEQISNNLGISTTTFYEYKKNYPEFSESLKRGKEIVDYEVENALLKRALGYEFEEKTYETRWDENQGRFREVLTKKVRKEVVPDTTAQIYWLNNRKPKQWRNKRNEEEGNNENLNKVEQLLTKIKEEANK
nr:MAG TPA: terminase small subunit [Caudoviricetes sp.]